MCRIRSPRSWPTVPRGCAASLTAILLLGGRIATCADTPPSWQATLEASWITDATLGSSVTPRSKPNLADDAAGGCDGVTNGSYGFHTADEENPWWQVDLGEPMPVSQVRVWNRSDSTEMAARASHFQVRLSTDATSWQTVYAHPGKVFYGYHMPDRSPLVVRLTNATARFVRIQLPGRTYLHLDEVEVIRAGGGGNVAQYRPATQSSLSPWSTVHPRRGGETDWKALARAVARECERLGRSASAPEVAAVVAQIESAKSPTEAQSAYFQARSLRRQRTLSSPLLDFDAVLFTKRVPSSYNHMSDQYYGWWSRPGGGLFLLRNFKSGEPTTECITERVLPGPGSFLRPALSYDARKVLFAWCRHYPDLAAQPDKLNKANVPEDAFYHVFEMNLDGTGLRQLTRGKYDDFDGRYLPDGRIVFLSTRRGQALQAGRRSAQASVHQPDLPDCYVRCGGDASRPVAVYTLHTMNGDGSDVTAISPFEMFEWEPSVANDGTVLYSRWDYIDRDNMPYMSLWAINPDGTNARLVYGNYTKHPHCTFEPHAIPGSAKILFTASGHHSQTMGSLVLLDPALGTEGEKPVERLTPETPFPEIEGWPQAYYSSPWPLSERLHLVAWGMEAAPIEGRLRSKNGMGLYLFHADAGRELLYRDPEISSMYPIPVKAQTPPPALADHVDWNGPQEGRFLVSDVYRGLRSVKRGEVKALRVVGVPAKTQPWMNQPVLGLTRDDPGKVVLGTVPVEADGSAHFRVPSGVAVFFQALDARGRSLQTMRSATHVQPGQTLSCTGCHEGRQDAPPPTSAPLAARREPSRLTPGPAGSWPLRFDHLIQPLLNDHCVRCHQPAAEDRAAARFDLTPHAAYEALAGYGHPSLREVVWSAYREGTSTEKGQPSQQSPLLALLEAPQGHHGVQLRAEDWEALYTWLDTYGQRQGHFSETQERELSGYRSSWADLLAQRPSTSPAP